MMKNGEYDGLTANTMKILSKLTTQQRTVNTVVVHFQTYPWLIVQGFQFARTELPLVGPK